MNIVVRIVLRFFAVLLPVFMASCMVLEKTTPPNADMAVSRRVAAGFEYLQMGQPSEARRHIARALESEPRSPEAHNAMALLYNYEGDTERAEQHFRKAIRYDRNYSLARNNYGALLLSQRKFKDALEQFSTAADDPSYDSRAIAFENKGRALMALERYDEALEAFNTTLRLNSQLAQPLLEMAWIYFIKEEFRAAQRAYDAYEAGIDAQPARGLWLGIQLAAKQKSMDKLASYELALSKLYPNSPEHREWRNWVDGGRQ
ncbi:MAG: type IV pilus biogenesis/stability protein PilW [Alcanivoracaceae bacterium]|jgi:type IV pilus assembly protein PilF|nr:type IV pilus biogenesis/stability protein PilW [Alcanivoracaceae bacterium]